jgi:triosephosphate isomerase
MRHKLVAGNWKMHGTQASARALLEQLTRHALPATVEVLVCPPMPYLLPAAAVLAGSGVRLGAQNVAVAAQGAYTGETSAPMLRDCACAYVLVGHSERRTLFGETSELVLAKTRQVLDSEMTPVVCIGETLAERDAGCTEAVVRQQVCAVADGLDRQQLQRVVWAYEPVWAIGTGRVADPAQANAVHAYVRGVLAGYLAEAAGEVRIIYGGSVKADNAAGLFACADIDGALVGGASLQAQDFVAICQAAANAATQD